MDILRLRDIRKRPLVLDGAFGSCLQEKYQTSFDSLWTSVLNIMNFEAVVNLHKDYIEAGADIITTNTFRTNPVAIKNSKMNISNVELIKKGVKLAIEARGKNRIIIAASNAPAEDCYQVERTISKQELESNHKFHIDNLMKFGCDVIWNETLSHFDEIDIISSYCYENKIPYVINLYFSDELKILSGENILDVIRMIKTREPIAIGFNCIKSETLVKLFDQYSPDHRWGFYLNCGSGNFTDSKINCGIEPQDYWDSIKKYLQYDPLYVGSCCGSSPKHTKLIKEKLSEIY